MKTLRFLGGILSVTWLLAATGLGCSKQEEPEKKETPTTQQMRRDKKGDE